MNKVFFCYQYFLTAIMEFYFFRAFYSFTVVFIILYNEEFYIDNH